MNENLRKAKAIEKKNKEKLLEHNGFLHERSGIYFLRRTDEKGIKYAYIGQAKHILTRLAQHLVGYQHIDLSLKKHGLWSVDNPYGWKVDCLEYPERLLDEMEQKYIVQYAMSGYQLRNKTSGSQGVGKKQIDEYKPSRTYRDGVLQGKKTLAKELSHIIEKHLEIGLKQGKENNKVSQKALEKFRSLLDEGNYENERT
jgi:hypothetical protein